MATYRAKRGQVIVVGTLLVAILALSVTLSVYRMSGGKEELRAIPVRETVLGIASDLDRALAYSLSNASKTYRSLWPQNSTEYAAQQANEQGRWFLSTWKRGVLAAYSNLGVGLEYTNELFNFTWGEGFGLSNARCMVGLNISGYGFTGWVGERNRAVGLSLDADSIKPTPESHETRMSFTLLRDGSRPISDLGPENESIAVLAHIAGEVWVAGNVTSLTYEGGGRYTLVFQPDVNPHSRGVILTVTTPEDQVVVSAFHRSEEKVQISFDSLDENRTSPTDHLGMIMLGDIVLQPLPESATAYTGQYLLRYVPEPPYVFLNWTVENASLAAVDDIYAELTSVNITGSTSITAYYGQGNGTGSGTSQPPNTLLVRSVEENGFSEGRGIVSLQQKVKGKWQDVEPPGQRILHNVTKSDDYGVLFEPQAGYRFVRWEYGGSVEHGHGQPPSGPNADIISVALAGGNVTAVYTQDLSGLTATITLNSRERMDSSENKGWISFNGTNYALPANVPNVPLSTYPLRFVPQNPNQVFLWWETQGDVIVTNGTKPSTTVVVQGDGTITAVYLEQNTRPQVPSPTHPWDYLYVDEGYWLMPSDLWSGDDGKLAPSFSMGEDKQVTLLASPLTPELRIAEDLNVMVFVRVNPPHSVKDITLELGFQWNNTYYLLGNQSYQINKEGVYVMPLDSTQAQYPGETGIIPANSTVLLWVTITFYPNGWGTFFLYHGITWPSYVYLGGVPADQLGG
ncbi:MAG: hypothetical protein QW057_03855 [Candidatus Bathyarchaeia archaeon]